MHDCSWSAASVGLCACIAAAILAPSGAHAQSANEAVAATSNDPVVTTHSGVFNGKEINYSATVESIDVPDSAGKPSARIVSFSYVAENAETKRPVLFVFNGGPITASLWLHIGALGPKRVAVPKDLAADPATFVLADNAYSPLDAADLVFFDPASTGFSRVLPGVSPEAYHSVVADGQQTAAFIVEWMKKHDRVGSPIYLLGESYGTLRAAETAAQLTELVTPFPSDGVFLMGQAVNIIEYAQRPRNIISYVVSLPTLAALAWSHEKINRKGRTFDEFIEASWEYARTEYLTALFEGNSISDESVIASPRGSKRSAASRRNITKRICCASRRRDIVANF